MRKQICVKCGATAAAGGFCKNHFKPLGKIADVRPKVVSVCRSCGKISSKGRNYATMEKFIASCIASKRGTELDIVFRESGKKIIADVRTRRKEAGMEISDNVKHVFRMSRALCLGCSRASGGYNEAIIQFRGESVDDIMPLVRNKSGFINDTKSGKDFYFMSKGDAAKIAKALRRKYSVKHTRKLMGQKKDRRIYKYFYAVR